MTKSKSAYSTPSKIEKSATHIIVVWVDNESGVLARVVGLFSGIFLAFFIEFVQNERKKNSG